jgi:hypothetical protein
VRRVNLAIFALTLLAAALTLPAIGAAAPALLPLWAAAALLLACGEPRPQRPPERP